jgi:enoyl-CoA hydratase/carnithine racemase
MKNLNIETTDGVAVMTLSHKEQNQFTTPFLQEINSGLADLASDRAVRGVVVTGAHPKFFSTGIHLEWLMGQGMADLKNVVLFTKTLNQTLLATTDFPKPLVAALNGHAVAGGAILAACMDYRLMPPDRGFVRLPEVQIDIPFWPGMNAIFQAILPPASFRDMAYTGDRFTSAQAHEMGYVDELVDAEGLMARAVELASKLGQSKTRTYAAIKREMRRHVLHLMRTEDPKAGEALLKTFENAAS